MFRNNQQAHEALHYLLRVVRLERLWDPKTGPTDDAMKAYDLRLDASSSELVMVQAAFAIWNTANTRLTFGRMLAVLDAERMREVCTLLLALDSPRGSSAVDDWIAERKFITTGKPP